MISHLIAIYSHLPTAFNLTVPSLTFRSALWGPFTPACSYFNPGYDLLVEDHGPD